MSPTCADGRKTFVKFMEKPVLSFFLSIPSNRQLRQPVFTSAALTRPPPGKRRAKGNAEAK